MSLAYRLEATDGAARAGSVEVRGRRFDTPAFMPVGTAATVKALAPSDLIRAGAQIVLSNTYHLRLRPGHERVREFGGLHAFMGWDGAILTDSGGYQIFSLRDRVKVDDDGATFSSHLDGEVIRLTPEEALRIQDALDSDIAMVLDQPVPLPAAPELVRVAAERTIAWAERSIDFHQKNVRSGQALFAIVQGAIDLDRRRAQAATLTAMPFHGFAVGGLAVGETPEQFAATLESTLPHLPPTKPRYVMGVGYPEDLLLAIGYGADMFDCVLPTRHARTGQAFTSRGVIKLRNARWRTSKQALDPSCGCETCQHFTLGYLSHLIHSDEMLGPILVARHNVFFYENLVRGARAAIVAGIYDSYRTRLLADLAASEVTDAEAAP
ncbi:MAG: tRNA guanosine(34) transglycosylase Tgt [Planctomycetes bacterium]|nr:tRNA guanosine(34) transglycosylase Tgt [Planctomycetota bacterium]